MCLIRSFSHIARHESIYTAIYTAINYLKKYIFNVLLIHGHEYDYNFIYLANPSKKHILKNNKKNKIYLLRNTKNKLKINWIIPDFGRSSGGHMDIFRIIHHLERFGHSNNIYIFGHSKHGSAKNAKKIIDRYFIPLKANVYLGLDNFEDCDVAFATSWQTAYPLYNINNVLLKCYLVQDFEPSFYPMGSEYVFAENTYKFGFKCITLGPWLAKILNDKYNINADYFDMAYDAKQYFPDPNIERDEKTIAFYSRFITPRRAFELGILALQLVLKKHPDVKVICYGWDTRSQYIPFKHKNMGILNHDQLRGLYNKATIGLVFSLTNCSLVPYEMMGCKLPVVEIKNGSTLTFFRDKKDIITLCDPDPFSIANSIIHLLENKEKRKIIAEKAYEYVKHFNWEKSCKKIEDILYKELIK